MFYQDRKHSRLKKYDYGQNGYYYVTICTKNKACILGRVGISDLHIPTVYLSTTGKIVKKYIDEIETAYATVHVDHYVVMPNHIHMILVLKLSDVDGGLGSGRPTVQRVIHGLKAMITKEAGRSIWQSSFYEHVIRNQESYEEIFSYISGNPGKWLEMGGTEI